MATNTEKHILQCYRWVVYVTQNQRICDYIEILFFLMVCFKTNIFKNIFTENKVNAEVFEKSVSVASLTEPLSFCVSDYDRKIKENSHSL